MSGGCQLRVVREEVNVESFLYFFFRNLFEEKDRSNYKSKQLAPWVPTKNELIPYIMRLAKVSKNDVFYDLGCGDGRVVIEAAKRGAYGVCIDINAELLKRAIDKAKKEGVINRIKFINKDFFDISLEDATVIYMYLLTFVNALLKDKIRKETREGTRIITLDFEIPEWKPVHVIKVPIGYRDAVLYLYVRGKSDT